MAAVAKTSSGGITFHVHSDWQLGKGELEKRTIADIAAGRADVGYVGARALDTVGGQSVPTDAGAVPRGQPRPAGEAVQRGHPTTVVAPDVRSAGVEGLAVLPGPMRTMLGVRRTFTRVADFAGAVVGVQSSEAADATFHALGATTRPMPSDARLGGVDGYEQQMSSIYGNHYGASSKAVTGDLDFWPKTYVVIMNRQTYRRLSPTQRHAQRGGDAGDPHG